MRHLDGVASKNPREDKNAARWSRVRDLDEKEKECATGPSIKDRIAGRTLDWSSNWALIKLEPTRFILRGAPPVPASSNVRTLHIPYFAKLRKFHVAKHGRTTDRTTGTIRRVGSLVHPPPLRYENSSIMPADSEHKFGDITLTYSIMSDAETSQGVRTEILECGDSGSIVLLNENNSHAPIVGLGYAANEHTLVSYIMPMDLIIADIQHVTGMRVTYPVLVETAPGPSEELFNYERAPSQRTGQRQLVSGWIISVIHIR